MKLSGDKESLNMKIVSMKTELRMLDQADNRRALSHQVCPIHTMRDGRAVVSDMQKPIDEEIGCIKEIFEQNFKPKEEEFANIRRNSQPIMYKKGDGMVNSLDSTINQNKATIAISFEKYRRTANLLPSNA